MPPHPIRGRRRQHLAAALLAAMTLPAAQADENRTTTPLLPAYAEECGACHVAYPPGALPAASWATLMGTLDRHFGSDASLDPKLTQTLSAWLQARAATGRRGAQRPPEDRITRSAWFQREHDEVDPAVWQRPGSPQAAGVSPSQCDACHTRAAEGSYREHEIRIPR